MALRGRLFRYLCRWRRFCRRVACRCPTPDSTQVNNEVKQRHNKQSPWNRTVEKHL